MQYLFHDGLMTSVQQRDRNCNYMIHQMVFFNEPAHIQTNSSLCIDLIFFDQQNLSVNTGAHAALPPSHHQMVHSSFNLNIYCDLRYQCQIWS